MPGGMTMSESMPGMDNDMTTGGNMTMPMDMIDAAFDAYVAHDSMLDGPKILRVDQSTTVRSTNINAAGAASEWIDLGAATGRLVAVDGMDVTPIAGRLFEIAMARRLVIDLMVPHAAVAIPTPVQREG